MRFPVLLVLWFSLLCCAPVPLLRAANPPVIETHLVAQDMEPALDGGLMDFQTFLESLSHPTPLPDFVAPKPPPPRIAWLEFSGPVGTMTSAIFLRQLAHLPDLKPDIVVFEWRTGGGSVDDGFEMTKAIEALPWPTICVADGEVASEGIFLLQACDLRMMTGRSLLMVHEPRFQGQDINTSEVQRLLKHQSRINFAWTEHVGRRWKISTNELRKRIATGDWWMTAPEALGVGAVDAVIDDIRSLQKTLRDAEPLPAGLLLPVKP